MPDSEERPSPPASDDAELLRLIVESATDFAIFTTDPNGLATSWNGGAERLLGFTAEEIVGRSADIIFPPEAGGVSAAAEERRTALVQRRAEDERWQMRKDGTRFWASGLLMPLTGGSGGFVKILRDRTAQHHADEQLRANEELFRVLATNIPQLVFRSKPSGERTWGSPQWCVFTGLSFDNSVGLGWLDAIHPDDREMTRAAWNEAETSREYYVEHRIKRSGDGEYRWHQTRASPVEGGGDASDWVGTSTDIHDLRSLQEQQKVLLAELQHRTRNLLAVVQSLARQRLRASSSVEEFASEFESRLRALGRVQTLLARTDHQPVEIRELVESEINAHEGDRREPGSVQAHGPPLSVTAISAQALALALHELTTNAVKYGALGQPGAKLAVHWHLEGEGGKRRARLDWRETGVSMPEGGPKRRGYGSELITRALPYQLDAETSLEFGPDGVHCEIVVPMTGEQTGPPRG